MLHFAYGVHRLNSTVFSFVLIVVCLLLFVDFFDELFVPFTRGTKNGASSRQDFYGLAQHPQIDKGFGCPKSPSEGPVGSKFATLGASRTWLFLVR